MFSSTAMAAEENPDNFMDLLDIFNITLCKIDIHVNCYIRVLTQTLIYFCIDGREA